MRPEARAFWLNTILLAVGNLHNSAYDSTVLIVTDCNTRSTSNKSGRVRSSVCPSVRLFRLLNFLLVYGS